MRILRVHNRYQLPGGEDAVFEAETRLLCANGHQVDVVDVSNDQIGDDPTLHRQIGLAINTVWSRSGRQLVARAIAESRPEVVHVDNWFPLLSPAIYGPAVASGAAVVQTLHNYRLLCPSATFYRDGRVCEDCLARTPPLPGVVHACYRDSRSQTAAVAATLTVHRLRRTWSREVDRYIALTGFARDKFVQGGLPAHLIAVKPNFVDIPSADTTDRAPGALFVGRLAPEKGISTLLAAAELTGDIPIRLAGDGPLADLVQLHADTGRIRWLGQLPHTAIQDEMRSTSVVVFPSEWYEGFPLTLAEAFACGTPVIASRLGAMAEILEDSRTGLLFEPGNPHDLAAKLRWAHEHPAEMRVMGENARREYEAKYTPERNYDMLMGIYDQAIQHARSRRK